MADEQRPSDEPAGHESEPEPAGASDIVGPSGPEPEPALSGAPAGARSGKRIAMVVGAGLSCLVLGGLIGATVAGGSPEPAPTVTAFAAMPGVGPISNGATPEASGSVLRYRNPPWATPVSVSGVLVGSAKGDGFAMDVYRVARVVVKDDAPRSDPAAIENFDRRDVVAANDVVDVYTCVITNTGSIPLRTIHGGIQGLRSYYDHDIDRSLTNWDLFEKYRVRTSVDGYHPDDPYQVARGESVTAGRIVRYRPGEVLNFEATISTGEDGNALSNGGYRHGALHIVVE